MGLGEGSGTGGGGSGQRGKGINGSGKDLRQSLSVYERLTLTSEGEEIFTEIFMEDFFLLCVITKTHEATIDFLRKCMAGKLPQLSAGGRKWGRGLVFL